MGNYKVHPHLEKWQRKSLQLSYTMYLRAFWFQYSFQWLSERCCTLHLLKWKDKQPVHIHHSFIRSKRLSHPDPPWHSQLMMQHRVPSAVEQALLTQTLLTHHLQGDMGEHSTGTQTHILPTLLIQNKGNVFNRLAQPESRTAKNSPALRSCTGIFRGAERRFDRWVSTNGWLGAKGGKTTKEMEKIIPSLWIYFFLLLAFCLLNMWSWLTFECQQLNAVHVHSPQLMEQHSTKWCTLAVTSVH